MKTFREVIEDFSLSCADTARLMIVLRPYAKNRRADCRRRTERLAARRAFRYIQGAARAADFISHPSSTEDECGSHVEDSSNRARSVWRQQQSLKTICQRMPAPEA